MPLQPQEERGMRERFEKDFIAKDPDSGLPVYTQHPDALLAFIESECSRREKLVANDWFQAIGSVIPLGGDEATPEKASAELARIFEETCKDVVERERERIITLLRDNGWRRCAAYIEVFSPTEEKDNKN